MDILNPVQVTSPIDGYIPLEDLADMASLAEEYRILSSHQSYEVDEAFIRRFRLSPFQARLLREWFWPADEVSWTHRVTLLDSDRLYLLLDFRVTGECEKNHLFHKYLSVVRRSGPMRCPQGCISRKDRKRFYQVAHQWCQEQNVVTAMNNEVRMR